MEDGQIKILALEKVKELKIIAGLIQKESITMKKLNNSESDLLLNLEKFQFIDMIQDLKNYLCPGQIPIH